jgi:hypothetical protein
MAGVEAASEICEHKLRQWEESNTSVWLIKNVHMLCGSPVKWTNDVLNKHVSSCNVNEITYNTIKNGDNLSLSHTFPSSTESQSETNGYGHDRLHFVTNLMDLVDHSEDINSKHNHYV